MKCETSTNIQKENGEGHWFSSAQVLIIDIKVVTEQNNAKGRLGAMHILMAFPLCPN